MDNEIPLEASTPQVPLVNVFDPDTQELGSIPANQLQDAIQQGYQPATSQQLEDYSRDQKYNTLGQQVKAGAEAAAEAATFGLSTGLETGLGIAKPEDIRERRERYPGTRIAAQIPALAATAFIPGLGEANLLERAGQGAAELAGLGAAKGTLAKIGSQAVKTAAETALLQTGDEVSKMLAEDPNQTLETAMVNVGMSGLLGGGMGAGFGSVSPLWKATSGPKVGTLLKSLSDKAGGIESLVPDAIHDATQMVGMDVAPEIKAALSGDPHAQAMFQTLQESATGSGLKAQEALRNFKSSMSDSLVSALGKTAAEAETLTGLSEYEAGKQIQNSLFKELKEKIDPISKQFESVKERFKGAPLVADEAAGPGTTSQIADKVAQLAESEGYAKAPSSPQAKVIGQVLKELPLQETLDDLRKYQSIVGDMTSSDPSLYRLGSQLRRIFRDSEESVVTRVLGEKAPELLETHALARGAYREAMETIDELNARLHVGRYSGPDSFLNALKEMSPEDVARRISGKADGDLLNLIQSNFPKVAEEIQNYHIDKVLKNAAERAQPNESVSSKVLLSNIQKMSPELRNFVFSGEAQQKIAAIEHLMGALPSKINNSGTAKALDALWSNLPASAMGVLTMLTTHNPLLSLIMAPLTKWMGRDIPDTVRLALLKFMGSSQPIETEGFKAMVDFIHHVKSGENLLNKSTKAFFKAGAEILPRSALPTERQKEKLDQQIEALKKDQRPLFEMGGKMAHYLPNEGERMGQMGGNAFQYLSQLKPSTDKQNPLDGDVKPSQMQKAQYDRALEIAEQPLVVLKHMKNGTLTPQDVVTMHQLYPALYQRISQKLFNEMTEAVQKKVMIPYKERLNLSLFLGKPMDSTMTPQAIISTQPKAQSQAMNQPETRAKHSMAALGKMSQSMLTPSQSRAMERSRP
jgi:hypothetical protein